MKHPTSNQVDSEAFKVHQNEPKIPSMTELFQEYGNDLSIFEYTDVQLKLVSHNDILQYKYKSFFTYYAPQRTLRALLYLVQVDLSSTS